MNLCPEYQRAQDLQAQASFYGDALRQWQSHLQHCSACAAQHSAAQELRFVLGSEAVPQVPRRFAEAILLQVRAAHLDVPRLSRRARILLALNWGAVALACGLLLLGLEPAQNWRSVSFVLPALFTVMTALLAVCLRRPRYGWADGDGSAQISGAKLP